MKKWLLAIVFGAVLILGACGGDNSNKNNNANSGDNSTPMSAGEEAYVKNNCASCHGADLSGGAGVSLEKVGSELSAEEIEDVIENGKGRMPAQNKVSDEDRAEIAEWLASKK